MPTLDPESHNEPDKWCQAPLCKDTNWGGYNRRHTRGPNCPPYNPNPEPNPRADFWEEIREQARRNGARQRAKQRAARPTMCAVCRCPLGYDENGEPICPNCPDPDA